MKMNEIADQLINEHHSVDKPVLEQSMLKNENENRVCSMRTNILAPRNKGESEVEVPQIEHREHMSHTT
jgi:hypothetical protein